MRAANINSLSVVSVLFLTMSCANVPVWADVIISCAQVGDTNEVIISYDATSETNLVRAFALDIRLDNDANITKVTGISDDYYIYPGTIRIDAFGNVVDFGTALADYNDLPSGTLTGLDSNSITIEMASLYAPVGPGSPNAPAKSGDLVSIRIDGDCVIAISANVARAGATGVVMEDPNEIVEVNFSICIVDNCFCCPRDCMKTSAPEYADWQDWGEPDCWCYAKQCRGDTNGSSFFGKPVTLADLNIFKQAFNISDAELALVLNGICADLNHAAFFGKRVTLTDLNTFKLYFNLAEASVPECDPTNYNFWETP